jgi:hypothetical protein
MTKSATYEKLHALAVKMVPWIECFPATKKNKALHLELVREITAFNWPSRPAPMTSGDAADQVIAVKHELYKLRDYIQQIAHVEQRDRALKHFETAYNEFDKLQEFLRSRA